MHALHEMCRKCRICRRPRARGGCCQTGEEALLQGEGKDAPVRPCAYRAVGGCTLWALVCVLAKKRSVRQSIMRASDCTSVLDAQ